MRSSILITLASAMFATAELTPVVKRQAAAPAINDTQILQFALTLEHLEAVFCKSSLFTLEFYFFVVFEPPFFLTEA
jgi:hypothetical protein